jgi:hypothetical protein
MQEATTYQVAYERPWAVAKVDWSDPQQVGKVVRATTSHVWSGDRSERPSDRAGLLWATTSKQ